MRLFTTTKKKKITLTNNVNVKNESKKLKRNIESKVRLYDLVQALEKMFRLRKKKCSNVKCSNSNPVGAHVQKYKSTDEKHYIVPLCRTCNTPSNTKIIDIGSTKLVRANKSETCAKKTC